MAELFKVAKEGSRHKLPRRRRLEADPLSRPCTAIPPSIRPRALRSQKRRRERAQPLAHPQELQSEQRGHRRHHQRHAPPKECRIGGGRPHNARNQGHLCETMPDKPQACELARITPIHPPPPVGTTTNGQHQDRERKRVDDQCVAKFEPHSRSVSGLRTVVLSPA